MVEFECVVCMDSVSDAAPVIILGDKMCPGCFKKGVHSQFVQALAEEQAYPVKYGDAIIRPIDFPDFFSAKFVTDWEIKEIEYKTPLKERLYCRNVNDKTGTVVQQCGKFLGNKCKVKSSVATCTCTGKTCSMCSEPIIGTATHECETLEQDPLAGLKRGEDYQLCPNPNCGAPYSLRDGCNQVTCEFCPRPDNVFCFICGEPEDVGHWDVGKPCPRFGKKGHMRAIFDEPEGSRMEDDEVQRWGFFGTVAGPRDEEFAIREANRMRTTLVALHAPDQQGQADSASDPLTISEERMVAADRASLREIPPLVITPPPGEFTTLPERIESSLMVHKKWLAVEVYTADVKPQDPDSLPFREVEENRLLHQDILATLERLGPSMAILGRWPRLQEIVRTYLDAWEGRLIA